MARRGRPGPGQLSFQFEDAATEAVPSRLPRIQPPRYSDQRKKLPTPYVFTQENESEPRPWIDVGSTRISRMRYDDGLQQVQVTFSKNGVNWVYEDVPPAVYEAFADSPSKGRFIHDVLDSYAYRQASPVEEAQWER